MVRDQLAQSPFAAEPRGAVVLTGGASQLTGLPELAARILGRPVRIGRPLGIGRLPRGSQGAGFRRRRAACWSIRRTPISNMSSRAKRVSQRTGTGGYFGKVGRWLRESF